MGRWRRRGSVLIIAQIKQPIFWTAKRGAPTRRALYAGEETVIVVGESSPRRHTLRYPVNRRFDARLSTTGEVYCETQKRSQPPPTVALEVIDPITLPALTP